MAEPKRRSHLSDFDDWAMLALAVFSVGLIVWVLYVDPSLADDQWVYIVDGVICGIFFVEFMVRWRAERWRWTYPLAKWYEILGMIPMIALTHPALRGLRFIRIVVVIFRLTRAADRAFGHKFTFNLVDKLSEPIVRAIKKPITLAVMDEVMKILETGNYPHNIARALDENRDELRAIISEKLENDPQARAIKFVPFHDQIVTTVVDTSLRMVMEMLVDPRVDELISDILRENRMQIRRAIEEDLHEMPPRGRDPKV